MTNVFRQHIKADANHMIHLTLSPEMSEEVEIIVLARSSSNTEMSQESLLMAQIMDESRLAKNILNSVEEDCWNDL